VALSLGALSLGALSLGTVALGAVASADSSSLVIPSPLGAATLPSTALVTA
jgi:hypothetical protein